MVAELTDLPWSTWVMGLSGGLVAGILTNAVNVWIKRVERQSVEKKEQQSRDHLYLDLILCLEAFSDLCKRRFAILAEAIDECYQTSTYDPLHRVISDPELQFPVGIRWDLISVDDAAAARSLPGKFKLDNAWM